MENHNFLLKLSRLFPSSFTSCQARTRPDAVVANRTIKNEHPSVKGRKCPPVGNPSSSSHSGRWFTSGDERTRAFDTDTFYTVSSNSGDSFRRRAAARRQAAMKSIDETRKCTREAVGSDHGSTRIYYEDGGCRRRRRRRRRRKSVAMEEGVAVEKRSRDPYGDFMGSMVEMIVEKRMFGEEDLERLLSCYLKLNKEEYHGIIVKVFDDICQTLLCN